MTTKSEFLYPHASYTGKFTPQALVFNANLQEFSQQVSYIANLTCAGKLPPKFAYAKLEVLWQQLSLSKQQLIP